MNDDKLRWAAMYDAWASEQEAVSDEMLKDLGLVHEVERKLREYRASELKRSATTYHLIANELRDFGMMQRNPRKTDPFHAIFEVSLLKTPSALQLLNLHGRLASLFGPCSTL